MFLFHYGTGGTDDTVPPSLSSPPYFFSPTISGEVAEFDSLVCVQLGLLAAAFEEA